MTLDLADFGIEPNTTIEEEEEETEAVQTTEQETTEPDTTDRSVPLLKRIDRELHELKFSAGLTGDLNLASAEYLATILKGELTPYEESKWDSNGWTFPKLWQAVQDKAKEYSGGKSIGLPDNLVVGWALHFIVDERPKVKKATPSVAPKTSKPPKKEPPKATAEQLHLDLSDF